jgi:hypothetical protein
MGQTGRGQAIAIDIRRHRMRAPFDQDLDRLVNRLDLWAGEAHRAREWRQMVRAYL